MSDGIRDAEGRRPDWLSLSSGMGESKIINGLRADLERAECKIDSLTKRLIDADQDVTRLRAELAAAIEDEAMAAQSYAATIADMERQLAACYEERVAALNRATATDIELGQARERSAGLEKRLNELVPMLGWVNQMAGQYSRECTAERERRELAEQASAYNLDVCEQMESRAKLAEERSAALAAALEETDKAFERFASHHGSCCDVHNSTDETAPGECELCDIDRGARRHGDLSAILSARDARFTETWRKEVDAMRDERDAMAAALALAEQHMTGPHGSGCVCNCPVIDGHASGCKIVDAMVSGGGLAILAARDASQRRKGWVEPVDDELIVSWLSPVAEGESFKEALGRLVRWHEQVALDPCVSEEAKALLRKGAAWALRRIIDRFATEHDRPWFEKMLSAIERGEVEVA